MGTGSLLVGVALAVVVGAYLARPLCRVRPASGVDRQIDAWVAQVREEWDKQRAGDARDGSGAASGALLDEEST